MKAKLFRKLTSRKLWAFTGACGLLVFGQIEEATWLPVALAYMGGQALHDAAQFWRRGED